MWEEERTSKWGFCGMGKDSVCGVNVQSIMTNAGTCRSATQFSVCYQEVKRKEMWLGVKGGDEH